jgi:alcohol dehydrogenase-like protein
MSASITSSCASRAAALVLGEGRCGAGEQGAPVRAAEHARETTQAGGDLVDDLPTLADAQQPGVQCAGDPDRDRGVGADAVPADGERFERRLDVVRGRRLAEPRTLGRLALGVRRPRRKILGRVFAGEVVGVGEQVTDVSVGDRVCGVKGMEAGTHAQYVVAQWCSLVATPRPSRL